MTVSYLGSNAAIKLYRLETGSAAVEQIVNEPDSLRLISRLTVVETERAFGRRMESMRFLRASERNCALGSILTCAAGCASRRSPVFIIAQPCA
jgi:hypothetical protein